MNHTEKPMTGASDPAAEQLLVVAAKMGDEQASEDLFKRYQRRIFCPLGRAVASLLFGTGNDDAG